ncbi:g3275 [Coccomyxa elongata]
MPLSAKDEGLIRLFMTASFHQWDQLPALGKVCLEAGNSAAELRGCIRHMSVLAGYAPCLAATATLTKAGVLGESEPGKAGGPPGNAFNLVYNGVVSNVWSRLYTIDGVLAEWIRLHAYGDVYSNPGLSLQQKQLITSAFLSEANMHDEMFGHLLAAMRFGADEAACRAAIEIAFRASPAVQPPHEEHPVYRNALGVLSKAVDKVQRDGLQGSMADAEVLFLDETCVRLPQLPDAQ